MKFDAAQGLVGALLVGGGLCLLRVYAGIAALGLMLWIDYMVNVRRNRP